MTQIIKYDGRDFPIVDRPTFAEMAWLEKQAKTPWSELGDMLSAAAAYLLSLRRGGVMLTWDDMLKMSPADFDVVDSEGEQSEDPTPPTSGDGPTDGGVTTKVRRPAKRTVADKNRKHIIAAGGIPPAASA